MTDTPRPRRAPPAARRPRPTAPAAAPAPHAADSATARPPRGARPARALRVIALSLLALGLPAAAHARRAPPPPPAPIVVHPGTLIDHVNGIALDPADRIVRFSALVIDGDGRTAALLTDADPRPHMAYALDAHGRTLVPGLVAGSAHLVATGLAMISGGTPLASLPPPRPEDRDLALVTVQKALLARGITGVTDIGTTIEDWQALRRAGDAGRLALRVVGYADGLTQMVVIAGPGPTPWLYDGRLRLAGVWLPTGPAAADTGRHPAWSAVPLADPVAGGDRALIQLKNELSRAAMDHFQPVIPVADVATRDRALDAIADVAETYHGDRRWRLMLGADDASADLPAPDSARLAALHVTTTAAGSPPSLAAAPDALAAVLAGPAPPPLPAGLSAAALATRTRTPAQAAMAEATLGNLAPGLYADFLLLDGDPTIPAAPAPRLLETWIGGRLAWAPAGRTAMGALAPEH